MEFLWEKYGNALYGIISRSINDPHYAEEVLQDAMLKIWKGIKTYNSEKASFFTWASTVARNAALDRVRLKSYNRAIKTKSIDKAVIKNRTVETSSDKIDIAEIIKVLDDNHRLVLEGAYFMGFTHVEIAEQLEIPLGTVKTRIRNAIQMLREHLKNEKKLFLGVITLLLILLFS